MHTRDVVAPDAVLYEPAKQEVHTAEVAPPVEYDPGWQRPEQAAVVDPPVPYVPAGQGAVHVGAVSPEVLP